VSRDASGIYAALSITLSGVEHFAVAGTANAKFEIFDVGILEFGSLEGSINGPADYRVACEGGTVSTYAGAPATFDSLTVHGSAFVENSGLLAVGPTSVVDVYGELGNPSQPNRLLLDFRWGSLLEERHLRVGGELSAVIFVRCPVDACNGGELNCFATLQGYIFAGAWNPQTFIIFWQGTRDIDEPGTGVITGPAFPLTDTLLMQGSFGVVPFVVNSRRSYPRNTPHSPFVHPLSEQFLTSAFNGTHLPNSIAMHMTGPVSVQAANNQPPLEVVLMDHANPDDPLLDVSRFVTVERHPTRPHVISIRAKDGANVPLPSGVYRVTRCSGTNRVLCDQLLPGSPLTEIGEFEYRFRLTADCDNNGAPDMTGECGSTSICDPLDFNNDGVFPDDQDAIDFFEVLAGGGCSTGNCNDIDFNNDLTFPDDRDIEAYFRILAGGSCSG
jgi:hypothetical protein